MYKIVKRLIDIICSSILLIILSPLFVAVIIILRFTGENEILYFQDRVGFEEKTIRIIKFATMIKNSPNLGSKSITLRNDPRVTKVGKILRKTKINELPQLMNVLKGEMTLVGPRPQMRVDYDCYDTVAKKYISSVKPGLTGLGSIFFRDEERLLSSVNNPREYYEKFIAPEKAKLEKFYVEHRGIMLDFKIILITIFVVLFPNQRIENLKSNFK